MSGSAPLLEAGGEDNGDLGETPKPHSKEMEGPVAVWRSVTVMFFNTAATVSIVVVNKALFTRYDFAFAPTTLLLLHQITCWVGACMVPRGEAAPTPRQLHDARSVVAMIALTRMGSNVFSTLSLKYNTVGMYQLYKMLSVPCVFVGELLFFGVGFRPPIAVALAALLVGLALATVNDVSFSVVGALCGCSAPLASSASSLIVKHVQLRHNIVGNDLLRAIALPLVFLHLPIVPLTDDIFRIPTWFREAGPVGLGLLLFTCGIAWALEWTYLLVMQYTSPMTMQVLGHVKTMLIIVSGIVLFHAPTSPKSALGIAIAMLGAVAYTWLKAAPAETGYSRQLCKDYLCPMLAAASVLGVVGLARLSARSDALTPAG